jgi:predicted amidohydrolase YtcJ
VTTTLFTGGTVRPQAGRAAAEWVLIDDGVVAGVGDAGDVPRADRVVDLAGGTLVPAFCDAHVHLGATGLYAAGLDFRGETSARRIVEALAARAREEDGILFGGNFEDPLDEPVTSAELDGAVGGRAALLARADLHSCVVSTALLNELRLDGVDGVEVDGNGTPTGYLRETAAAEAWRWFDRHLSRPDHFAAIRAAVRLAYSKGISAVHEMFVVEWRGWHSFDILRAALEGAALRVRPYLATTDVARVKGLGLPCIGGDLFLDGSFGSHTAWMSEPYDPPPPAGSPPNGIRYRRDDELLDFFLAAQRAGLQTGVHAIGDAAIEQAIAAWEEIAQLIGWEPVTMLGHRIEHFECARDDHLARARRLGLRISVQPAFDRLWGGDSGLYARRIGASRSRSMNRFGSMLRAGLELGAGSDSTVTPLDPFLQMASLRAHHVAGESIDPHQALWLHTAGAHGLAPPTGLQAGLLAADIPSPADLAWLDRDPVSSPPDELLATEVLGTWIEGRRVWPEGDADAA